jgi:hypothetical protein
MGAWENCHLERKITQKRIRRKDSSRSLISASLQFFPYFLEPFFLDLQPLPPAAPRVDPRPPFRLAAASHSRYDIGTVHPLFL